MKGCIKNRQALALARCTTQGWGAGQPGQNIWLHSSLVADPCVIQRENETVEINGSGHSTELQRRVTEIALQAYVQGEQKARKTSGFKREITTSSTFEPIYN